ncbi:MAG: hypothetical protein SOT34_02770, partial [Candidatus Borkfalkiaceae bacterium]|nr:hypothetical protein [Christensenellaceae bacterium]
GSKKRPPNKSVFQKRKQSFYRPLPGLPQEGGFLSGITLSRFFIPFFPVLKGCKINVGVYGIKNGNCNRSYSRRIKGGIMGK